MAAIPERFPSQEQPSESTKGHKRTMWQRFTGKNKPPKQLAAQRSPQTPSPILESAAAIRELFAAYSRGADQAVVYLLNLPPATFVALQDQVNNWANHVGSRPKTVVLKLPEPKVLEALQETTNAAILRFPSTHEDPKLTALHSMNIALAICLTYKRP